MKWDVGDVGVIQRTSSLSSPLAGLLSVDVFLFLETWIVIILHRGYRMKATAFPAKLLSWSEEVSREHHVEYFFPSSRFRVFAALAFLFVP